MARIRPSSHRSQDIKRAKVFIPPNRYNFELKINVVTSSNGTIDLANYNSVSYVTVVTTTARSLSRGLGDATVILQNPMGLFNNIITGGEVIDIIAEYTDGTPTNNIFHGRIDGALTFFDLSNGFQMKLVCRQLPEVQDKFVSEQADNTVAYTFITQIIDNNFDGIITYNNMDSGMTTLLSRSYVFKPGSKTLLEVFDKCSYTGYIDSDDDIHSWSLTDAEQNSDEFIAFGINCNAVQPFGTDLRKTKNNVITTGDRVAGGGNLFYIWSKKDSANVSTYWQKDILLNDNAIANQDSVENDAVLSYDAWTRTDETGGMNSVYGLQSLRPGQRIQCYVPHCKVDGEYVVHQFTHTITPGSGSWITSVQIAKFSTTFVDLLKTRDDKSKGNVLASLNPNGMIGGFAITFVETDEKVMHDNTEIINGQLVLQSGFGTGTATTILKDVDEAVTEIEIRLDGGDLGASTVDVTVDNEELWETNTGVNTLNSYEIVSGSVNKKRLKYRINLVVDSDNPNPYVESSTCLFKY